jgi:hypothetical protein
MNLTVHVILTSVLEWDPSVIDQGFKEDEQWGDIPDLKSPFKDFGDYDFEDCTMLEVIIRI